MNHSLSHQIPGSNMDSDPGVARENAGGEESIPPGCSPHSVASTDDTPTTLRDEHAHVHAEEAEFVAIEIQTVSRVAESDKRGSTSPRSEEEEGEGKICRVCHLSLSESQGDGESEGDGVVESSSSRMEAIELGCGCKDDLAFAHRRCAETWFKIRGNRNCEICGKVVQNVSPGMVEEARSCGRGSEEQSEFLFNLEHPVGEEPSFWHHRPICNVVLAFIVIILLLPWLFRVRLF